MALHWKHSVSMIVTCILLACDQGFEEININPNQANNNPSMALLFGAIVPGIIDQNINSHHTPGQFVQQFAYVNSSTGTLNLEDDFVSRRAWEIAYSENDGALRNVEVLRDEAQKRDHSAYQAVAIILKAYMLSYISDLFGDIPYIDAGQVFKLEDKYWFPVYDPQRVVYYAMISDLQKANLLLKNSVESETIDSSRDLLFSGNKLKWRKFANSLQVRLLMRMSNVEDVSSDLAQIFGSSLEFPVMESLEDEPVFSYRSAANWPFNKSSQAISTVKLSSTYVEIMKGTKGVNQISDTTDPRLEKLLDPTEASIELGNPEYIGQPVGLSSYNKPSRETSSLSQNLRELNRFYFMTYSELNLIKAEAIHREMISGVSVDSYKEGVSASIERYGIDMSSTVVTNYLEDITSKYSGHELKHIAIQRWLDQPLNGFEGYSVWRRMDIPKLTLGPDVLVSQIPTRYFYSSKTMDKNQENADIAVKRAPLNGKNTTYQKVWWDSK
ncbi:SusD/RagB family nutrient-binding outer membrane lipoprotein [Reichenbachiella versicolor]|uniref:SusD/RagB family nutrient-binding outer membrane lipoprotein n=1 Tax=Reichenbachiella versicolor TaxID=1821036 RepID=UPI000D6E708F|nr:SusD/RagB family nutrient-binding outer membrane lipoprotein [Reichenbachiella versicolor]